MVQNITSSDLDLIKLNDCTILLTYANGCRHCETIKPRFEEYSNKFPELTFLKADLNEINDFYIKFADKQIIQNEDGAEVEVPVFTIPNFYIFVKALQVPGNEFGFAGGFDGANSDELQNVLDALQRRILGL